MAYAEYTDVQNLVKESGGSLTSAQQTRVTSLCVAMSNWIDGELGSTWVVPFPTAYPKLVVQATIFLAAAIYLRAEFQSQAQVEAMEARADTYWNLGKKIISDIKADKSLLSGEAAAVLRDSTEGIGPQMRTQVYPPSITLQDSSQWRQPVPDSSFGNRGTPSEYP